MKKIIKNGIYKSFISTILFGGIYTLVKFLIDGTFDREKLLITMGIYFVVMCLCYIIAPKLRGDKNNK